MNEVNFMTNEEVQTDDIARIIRTSYSLSPCTSDAAKAIYNSGYRKIDDKCAVITKDDLKLYQKQAVKEFAEKLKDKLLNFIEDNEDYDGKVSSEILYIDVIGIIGKNAEVISLGLIDELLKDYLK